ncbi:nucleoside recognition domain-containing protein, partial [Salinispira pacifica]
FGNQENGKSVLSAAGRAVTPVFAPMGITSDNWPATVALFSGVFAKEAVVGTLNSLYAETDRAARTPAPTASVSVPTAGRASAPEAHRFDFLAAVGAAFATVPEAVNTLWQSISDPLGLRGYSGAKSAIFTSLHRHFAEGPLSAYAYLLFILIYMPCLATMGTAMREMGAKYAAVMGLYLTLLAWAISTLFYQLAVGHSLGWAALSAAVLGGITALFLMAGRSRRGTGRGGDRPAPDGAR